MNAVKGVFVVNSLSFTAMTFYWYPPNNPLLAKLNEIL